MVDPNSSGLMTSTGALALRSHEETEALLLESELTIRDLRESEAFFRQLFEQHNSIMLLIDYQALVIVDANIAASKFYGYPIEILRGMKVSKINAQSESEILPLRQQAIIGVGSKFVLEHRLANNEIRTVEAHISTVSHENKNLFFSIIHDITEQKQSDEKILHLALRDHLTQLPNRHLFYDRLSQSMLASKRSGRYVALIMLDLDNFKQVNDNYGHVVGDSLLKVAAARLKMCVREVDTAARFGGDEFVVVLNELDSDEAISTSQALTVAQNILNALSLPYVLAVSGNDGLPAVVGHNCTASIGVAIFINNEASHEEIMKCADAAMYQAKDSGGNSIRVYDLKNRMANAVSRPSSNNSQIKP